MCGNCLRPGRLLRRERLRAELLSWLVIGAGGLEWAARFLLGLFRSGSVIQAPLPAAKETYYAVFADLDVLDQLRIQANAERQGAAAWRAMVSADAPDAVNQTLESMAALEESSADFLDQLLAA